MPETEVVALMVLQELPPSLLAPLADGTTSSACGGGSVADCLSGGGVTPTASWVCTGGKLAVLWYGYINFVGHRTVTPNSHLHVYTGIYVMQK